jgi:hypothetical protein
LLYGVLPVLWRGNRWLVLPLLAAWLLACLAITTAFGTT